MVVKGWISTNAHPDLSGTIRLNSRTYYRKKFFKRPLLRLCAPSIEGYPSRTEQFHRHPKGNIIVTVVPLPGLLIMPSFPLFNRIIR